MIWTVVFLGVLLASGLWLTLAYQRTLFTGAVLLFLTLTVHDRLQISALIGSASPATQGGVSIIDALWLGYFTVVVLLAYQRRSPFRLNLKMPALFWALLPYIVFSILLPLIGSVAMGITLSTGWSFGSTGFRQLQWLSYAFFAYCWMKWSGPGKTGTFMYGAVASAVVAHSIYGLMQWLSTADLLPSQFVILDAFYANNVWFQISPRPTGLALEPTALAIAGAIGLGASISSLLIRQNSRPVRDVVVLVASLIALLLSSDRLILAGAVAGSLLLFISEPRMKRVKARQLLIPLAGVLAVIGGALLLPAYHMQRILRLFSSSIVSEPNISDRLERWRFYLTEVWPAYPVGTGIQPTYAGGVPVDNYYLSTFIQGSGLYLTFFVAFLIALGRIAWLQRRAYDSHARLYGSLLIYLVGVVATGSLGAAPMFDVPLLCVLWVIVGATYYSFGSSRRIE